MRESRNNNSVFMFSDEGYKQPEGKETRRNEWIEIGEKNDFFDFVIDRYKYSVTNNAIINNKTRLAYGKGLTASDSYKRPSEYANLIALLSPEDLRLLIKNTITLGFGVIQTVKEKGKVRKASTVLSKNVRPMKCNDKGEITHYFYSDDWSDTRKYEPKPYKLFDFQTKDGVELIVIGEKSIDLKYFYEIPYAACLPYCVLEEEISDYLVNDVKNSFSGTKVINFNNGEADTEEAKMQIAKKVKNKLSGSGGEKFIISFNEDETKKTTIDDISLNDAPSHYEYLAKEAQQKILNNHNVVSSPNVGISIDGAGFSNVADEIRTGAKIFKNQSIKPIQDLIIEGIKKIATYNGCNLDLYFKDLDVLEESPEEKQRKIKEANSVKMSDHLDQFGEEIDPDWELLHESEVDYDSDDEMSAQLESFKPQAEKKTALQKFKALFASTGTARGNAKSSQDEEIDGVKLITRYQYRGSTNGQREFCNKMMAANKVYRKEDILRMGQLPVNAGFGENGADTYSIWKYKGGPRCSHKWFRLTFIARDGGSIDVNNPNAERLTRAQARRFRYNPINENEVSIEPRNMPHKGYHPNNPNKPIDAR